jgi:hypothetical protein
LAQGLHVAIRVNAFGATQCAIIHPNHGLAVSHHSGLKSVNPFSGSDEDNTERERAYMASNPAAPELKQRRATHTARAATRQ